MEAEALPPGDAMEPLPKLCCKKENNQPMGGGPMGCDWLVVFVPKFISSVIVSFS